MKYEIKEQTTHLPSFSSSYAKDLWDQKDLCVLYRTKRKEKIWTIFIEW